MNTLNNVKTLGTKNIKKGEIYWVDLPEVKGSSIQKGLHPCLALQNNIGNKHSPNAQFCTLTSNTDKNRLPTQRFIKADKTNMLRKDSIIQVESVTNVPKFLIGDYIGKITNSMMNEVDKAIAVQFGIKKVESFDETYVDKCLSQIKKDSESYSKYKDSDFLDSIKTGMDDIKKYCMKNDRDFKVYVRNIQGMSVGRMSCAI